MATLMETMRKMMRKLKGFTLIEMMLTLAISSVLVGLAVPSFSKMIERKRLGAAAEMVYEQLMHAKTMSIKRSKPITAEFSANDTETWAIGITDKGTCDLTKTNPTDADACTIEYDNDTSVDADGDGFNTDTVLMNTLSHDVDSNSIYRDVTMNTPVFGGGASVPRVSFNPVRGETAGGAVVLVSPDYQLEVVVSSYGRIRICYEDNGSGTTFVGYEKCSP